MAYNIIASVLCISFKLVKIFTFLGQQTFLMTVKFQDHIHPLLIWLEKVAYW